MKALLLVGPGANQCALADRLHGQQPLAHIAHITLPASKTRRKWLRSIVSITLARSLRNAWAGMMAHYERAYPRWPDVEQSHHIGVNSASVVDLIEEVQPELILVSGPDLLRAPLIDAAQRYGRIVNLHTGISPYLKGAPNCTNWALALGEFDMIGNTLMWLDAGIDSGALIATEATRLTGNESLTGLHIAVMDHAHDLFCRGYRRIASGASVPAIAQDSLGGGRLFRIRDWSVMAMIRAAFNFRFRYRPAVVKQRRPLTLVRLDQ